MKADVAILIVTYNSARHIGACLESLAAKTRSVRMQVVVLDNASADGTPALVREQFPWVELIEPGRNLGFAAGVNAAARQARADYLLLLNPDTELVNAAVDVVVEFARKHPRHGLYGGRTVKEDGSLEPSSCWGRPTLWSLALFATGITTLASRNRWLDPESLGSWRRDSVREVGVITGCFLLIAQAGWTRLGGFDERYFMYGEDVDLALRARAAGYRPVICPDAVVRHDVGQSSATPAAKMLLLYRGKASLVRTHWRGAARWAGLAFLTCGVGLRALLEKPRTWRSPESTSSRWETVWQARAAWLPGYPVAANSTSAQAAPGITA